MTDRLVDLVEEGIDCVVRGGELRDSSLVARRIAVLEQINCAEAGYLERRGEPMTLDDLKNHLLVGYFSGRGARTADWEYIDSGKKRFIKMDAIVSVNDAEAYVGCCLAGLGLVQLARCLTCLERQGHGTIPMVVVVGLNLTFAGARGYGKSTELLRGLIFCSARSGTL